MKKNEWKLKPEEARTIGSPVDGATLVHYRENFKKALEKTTGDLADAFGAGHGQRAGEFMGREVLENMFKAADKAVGNGNECVGIRTYYGLAYEELGEETCSSKISHKPLGDEKLRPRLFFLAVDQNGANIELDMSSLKDPDGNGWGNGLPMPPYGNG